jgi:hypothetical protein
MAKQDFLDTILYIAEAQRINQISLNASRSTSGPSSWTSPSSGVTYSVGAGGEQALAKKIRNDRSDYFGILDIDEDLTQAKQDIEDIQEELEDVQKIQAGATASRPVTPTLGEMYFDTDLGLPIWWNGTYWVDALGADADY